MYKKKTLVYPYDIEFSPLLRHSELLSEYKISSLVSPGGWGFNGKDASAADGGDKMDMSISGDFEASLPLCDAVLFSDSERELDFEKYILPKAISAAEKGKDIVCLRKLPDKYKKILTDTCATHEVGFTYCYDSHVEYIKEELDYIRLKKINTPVVFVTGIYEKTQKFEIQLSLREAFTRLGYRVSQIGSRGYCELMGFHSFPEFMYSPSKTEDKKILAFSHFLKAIENEENPDVIIIGIPGNIMRLNDEFTGRFGTMAYEVSQAITPDAAVMSTLYEEFEPEYFEKMAISIKYKLGFDISCFNLSNIKFDWDVSKELGKESYLMLKSSFIDEKKEKFNMVKPPVFNILNSSDGAEIVDHLIKILAYYGEFESI